MKKPRGSRDGEGTVHGGREKELPDRELVRAIDEPPIHRGYGIEAAVGRGGGVGRNREKERMKKRAHVVPRGSEVNMYRLRRRPERHWLATITISRLCPLLSSSSSSAVCLASSSFLRGTRISAAELATSAHVGGLVTGRRMLTFGVNNVALFDSSNSLVDLKPQ